LASGERAPTSPIEETIRTGNRVVDRLLDVFPDPFSSASVTPSTSGKKSTTRWSIRQPRNKEHSMKSLLALVTLALTVLIFEERARQVAGDAHEALDQAVVQARGAKQSLAQQIEQQPLISLLVAGGLAYVLASIIPGRD
jgi:hypothetical protein